MRLRLLAVATAVSTALVATPAHADSVRHTPAADATVRSSGVSRAASPLLSIGGRPRMRTLLRFRTRLPAGAAVSAVRLRLYATRRAPTGYRVLALGGRRATTWREAVRARRAPPNGRRLGRRGGWPARGYTTTALRRDAMTGAGPVAFAIVTRGRTRKRFHSREGRHPPRLVVEYTPPAAGRPEPSVTAPFRDEFDGPAGAPPDPATWAMKTGGRWMNGDEPELQCYTQRPENVSQDGLGHLAITARYEPGTTSCADGPNDYTSARLDTRGLRTFGFGRVEARIQLPTAAGSWPALWMLGATGTWPAAGEIDILEYRPGPAPGTAHHAIHADSAGDVHWQQTFNAPGDWSGGWHVFGVDRRRDRLVFEVDGVTTWTRTAADMPGGGRWRFNGPFGLLLNVAVGNWGGTPDPEQYPATMLVDWVRVTPPTG